MPSNQILKPSAVQKTSKKPTTVPNEMGDEMNAFIKSNKTNNTKKTHNMNKFNNTNLKESLINNKKDFMYPVAAFLNENILTIQSLKDVNGVSSICYLKISLLIQV